MKGGRVGSAPTCAASCSSATVLGPCVYFPVGFPPGLVRPPRAEACFGFIPAPCCGIPTGSLPQRRAMRRLGSIRGSAPWDSRAVGLEKSAGVSRRSIPPQAQAPAPCLWRQCVVSQSLEHLRLRSEAPICSLPLPGASGPSWGQVRGGWVGQGDQWEGQGRCDCSCPTLSRSLPLFLKNLVSLSGGHPQA